MTVKTAVLAAPIMPAVRTWLQVCHPCGRIAVLMRAGKRDYSRVDLRRSVQLLSGKLAKLIGVEEAMPKILAVWIGRPLGHRGS
jgi:hypothetical protein